jgi:hypothetical protein
MTIAPSRRTRAEPLQHCSNAEKPSVSGWRSYPRSPSSRREPATQRGCRRRPAEPSAAPRVTATRPGTGHLFVARRGQSGEWTSYRAAPGRRRVWAGTRGFVRAPRGPACDRLQRVQSFVDLAAAGLLRPPLGVRHVLDVPGALGAPTRPKGTAETSRTSIVAESVPADARTPSGGRCQGWVSQLH